MQHRPLAKGAGGFDVGRIIERGERVERCVGAELLDGAELTACAIEEHCGTDNPPQKTYMLRR